MTWADFVVRGTLVLAAGFLASFAFGRANGQPVEVPTTVTVTFELDQ